MAWSYFLLVFTDDEYGRSGAAAVQEYGESKGICFSGKIQVDINPLDRKSYYQSIAREITYNNAEGIIYFGQKYTGELASYKLKLLVEFNK